MIKNLELFYNERKRVKVFQLMKKLKENISITFFFSSTHIYLSSTVFIST